jgi:hypothetical protein
METITKDECLAIHKAIHNLESTTINGEYIPLDEHYTKCACMRYKGITFIEQNKNQKSREADMAIKGDKITWGIRPGKWIHIHEYKETNKIVIRI